MKTDLISTFLLRQAWVGQLRCCRRRGTWKITCFFSAGNGKFTAVALSAAFALPLWKNPIIAKIANRSLVRFSNCIVSRGWGPWLVARSPGESLHDGGLEPRGGGGQEEVVGKETDLCSNPSLFHLWVWTVCRVVIWVYYFTWVGRDCLWFRATAVKLWQRIPAPHFYWRMVSQKTPEWEKYSPGDNSNRGVGYSQGQAE